MPTPEPTRCTGQHDSGAGCEYRRTCSRWVGEGFKASLPGLCPEHGSKFFYLRRVA